LTRAHPWERDGVCARQWNLPVHHNAEWGEWETKVTCDRVIEQGRVTMLRKKFK
jgi:hypothetical protein